MATLPLQQNISDPTGWYRMMRDEHPIIYDDQKNAWNVFRYEDVARVLTDYATFYSPLMAAATPFTTSPVLAPVVRMDPLNHRQLHNVVMQAFTPQMIARMEPRISAVVTTLLDQVLIGNEIEVMKELAYPLPIAVIAEVLGIPAPLRADFKRWSDAVVAGALTATGPEVSALSMHFRSVLQQRRQDPQDDLLTALLAARINEQGLTDDELLGFCIALLASGTNSTSALIGNAILCFDEHPEVMDRLRREPTLMPGAIEEVLRYRSPIQALRRVTARETTLAGQQIDAHQTIIAWTGSANHDEAQFPDPERFDIQRSPNRHLAFAHGIHFCVGAPLARLEVKLLLNALLARLMDLRRRRDIPLDPVKIPVICALQTLPVRCTYAC